MGLYSIKAYNKVIIYYAITLNSNIKRGDYMSKILLILIFLITFGLVTGLIIVTLKNVVSGIKITLLGIAIILFGIALILCSSGSATTLGLIVAFIGLIISIVGTFIGGNK